MRSEAAIRIKGLPMLANRICGRRATRYTAAIMALASFTLAARMGRAGDERGPAVNPAAIDGRVKSPRSFAKQAEADPVAKPHIEGGQVSGRWREGSRLIDQLGYFKSTGDRITFISSDGKLKFDGLENLAIERIARTIGDSPDQLEWSVTGIITEYRGSNYLLVTQAVLKTKSARLRRAP